MGAGFMLGMSTGFRNIPTDMGFESVGRYCWSVAQPSLPGLAFLVATAMIVGVSANFAQVGFMLSGEAIVPSFQKLNPMNGLKRLFSFSATFDGAKALAKSALFGWVVYSAITSSWSQMISLSWASPLGALAWMGGIIYGIGMKVGLMWLAMASIDYFYQRKQIDKRLRMTKEEIRQEMKDAETSPELRAAIAQRRRKLSRGRMMEAIKKADVVITNPTHYAIAISYEPEKAHAPAVVAKGADILAARIRELAKEHKIPIVPNPPLARALYKQCEIGDFVPRDLFQAVAEVLAFVYRTLKTVKGTE